MSVAFGILAGLTVLGALLAVSLRNLVHAVLSLLFFFTALAGIFVLLLAEFIAAVQVLVYVGAVGVLILFAVMLTRDVTGEKAERNRTRNWGWGVALAAGLVLVVFVPSLMEPARTAGADAFTAPGSTAELGHVLMTQHVVAVQVMAFLLTAALIGAVVLATEDKS